MVCTGLLCSQWMALLKRGAPLIFCYIPAYLRQLAVPQISLLDFPIFSITALTRKKKNTSSYFCLVHLQHGASELPFHCCYSSTVSYQKYKINQEEFITKVEAYFRLREYPGGKTTVSSAAVLSSVDGGQCSFGEKKKKETEFLMESQDYSNFSPKHIKTLCLILYVFVLSPVFLGPITSLLARPCSIWSTPQSAALISLS